MTRAGCACGSRPNCRSNPFGLDQPRSRARQRYGRASASGLRLSLRSAQIWLAGRKRPT
jgi:hypothetical protein